MHEIVTLHQGTIRIEDVPASALQVAAAVAAGVDVDAAAEPATRRPGMHFVIRIPCEAPGTATV